MGLAVDAEGNVYVADTPNNRVLEYNTPLKSTGIPGSGDVSADLVFGQNGSFTSFGCNDGRSPGDVRGVGRDSLCFPIGLAAGADGDLYVAVEYR